MIKSSLTHLGLFVGRDRDESASLGGRIPPVFCGKAGYGDPSLQQNAYGIGKSFLRLLLVVLALSSQLSALNFSARATEPTDLGAGLAYLRVHGLDDSAKGLSAALREREFLVLDLRHATAESADLVRLALAARQSKQPVFILVSPATPAALAESLMTIASQCLTLGVKDSLPTPQVIIDQPAATDRLAYEALEAGQTLANLISGKITKERYDESVLMKEFTNGNINAAPPPAPDPTAQPASPEKAPDATASKSPESPVPGKAGPPVVEPLIDRVLQRAIHLHRALLAIKQR